MDGYQKQIDEGVQLRSNKEMAVAKREEVAGSINFAQEILNVLSLLSTEVSLALVYVMLFFKKLLHLQDVCILFKLLSNVCLCHV